MGKEGKEGGRGGWEAVGLTCLGVPIYTYFINKINYVCYGFQVWSTGELVGEEWGRKERREGGEGGR